MRPFVEQDRYPHIGNERNTLVCTRIDVEGIQNQRAVLTVPVTKLRFFEDYTLVIRQPIPCMAQGVPLYIKAVEDKAFVPDVSAGYGHKIYDEMDAGVNDLGYTKSHDGCAEMLEGNKDVEIIKERIEAKLFPVTMAPYGNMAFGADLLGCYDGEPRPFIKLYLNDQNEFVMTFCEPKKCHKPKRLVKVTEMITREPKTYDTIRRDMVARPFAQPQICRESDFLVQATTNHCNRW